MDWLKGLHGTIVGLDTAPLIYLIEKHPTYLPIVQPFFEAVERGDIHVVTSTLTLTEVLIHPLRRGNLDLVREYSRILLSARNLTMLSVTPSIAASAAGLRATNGLKAPDAIQLAAAQHGGASSFLTNDEGIASIPGVRMILLDRLLPRP